METAFLYATLSVLVVSLISLVGIAALSFKETFLRSSILFLVSLAVGALFGDALLHLLPEAIHQFDGDITTAGFWMLAGILVFFVLEKFLHWHHTHGAEDTHQTTEEVVAAHGRIRPIGRLVLVSDGFHNLIDGVIIGASFLISTEVGIATTIAVILHEIPQEIGDFGVLIHAGFTKRRAIVVNFLSALTAFLGAFLVFLSSSVTAALLPAVTALAAGSFIYIAGSDLVPELHQKSTARHSVGQFVAILIGIGLMVALLAIE